MKHHTFEVLYVANHDPSIFFCGDVGWKNHAVCTLCMVIVSWGSEAVVDKT